MRIAVLAPAYPSAERPHEYAFIHARTALYAARGHEVAVFVPGPPGERLVDGIPVTSGGRPTLISRIRAWRPESLAVHAPSFRTMPVARRIDCRQVSWVHGHEALFSLRRVHYAQGAAARAFKMLTLIPLNLWQLSLVRAFLRSQQSVVFVSEWMRRAAERHTLCRYTQAEIVPNPVDTELFSYRFDPANRIEGISARGLNSTKYGLDLAIRAFAGCPAAGLVIVGRGPLEGRYRKLIARTNSRAVLRAESIPHRDMPALYGHFGFFLAPSRVEAQGVAMCEAMSCGLPVIATRIGGIPEFVEHGREGFLVPPEEPAALRRAVEELLADPARHLAMSLSARVRMEAQCAPSVVTGRELALLAGK
jgi:glycosyltransferase involved in cell wall biosynthesis